VFGFFNLVDSKLNWGVSFHYNPLYLLFAKVQEGQELSYLPLSYLLFCQIFFFLPILVGLFKKFGFSLPFLIGTFSSLFFSIFVTDFLFWSSLHVVPLVVLLLGQLQKSRSLKIPLALLSALLWTWCAGPLAFIGSFFLLWLIHEEQALVKIFFLSSSLIFSVLFLVTFPLPTYPDGAYLSELSPVTFWPSPLWGPHLRPNPLLFSEYSNRIFGIFSTALTNLLLSLALLFQLKNRGSISKELHLILLVSIFLLIESRLGGGVTQNLATVMFGLPLLPFPWLLASLGILVGFGLFLNSKVDDNFPFNLGFTILVFFYLSNLISNFEGTIVEAQPVGTQFSTKISHESSEAIASNTVFETPNVTFVAASMNDQSAKLAADGLPSTQWSSNVPMTGSEWIELRFKEPLNCSHLALSPGGSKTDFPRGLRVEVTEDGVNYRAAAEIEHWKGPVRTTKEGFYYFGRQAEVEVSLVNSKKIAGLKIYQTTKDSFYFWSVAEVRCGS